ncbi:MAG: ATP-dependent Clp protease ATP-binding subunit [Bacteroidaceae bacterium]|nr:ATP-dependent Clp protease ATP-binding subunit [Bacteroidaceae bacterium]
MNNQFSENISRILTYSKEEADRLRCKSITPQHLLLGLLRDKDGNAANILSTMSVDLLKLKEELENNLLPQSEENFESTTDVVLDENASKVLRFCILEARMLKSNTVDTEHLLLAILKEKTNAAATILAGNNVTYTDVRETLHIKPDVRDGFGFTDEDDEEEENSNTFGNSRTHSETQQKQPAGDTPVLDNFGFDMTKAAKEGLLDPVVGREKEIERISQILSRRKKNNPVLIGEPGVGKSAISTSPVPSCRAVTWMSCRQQLTTSWS